MSDVFTYVIVERGGEPAFGFVEYDKKGGQRQHDLKPGEFWYDCTSMDCSSACGGNRLIAGNNACCEAG